MCMGRGEHGLGGGRKRGAGVRCAAEGAERRREMVCQSVLVLLVSISL